MTIQDSDSPVIPLVFAGGPFATAVTGGSVERLTPPFRVWNQIEPEHMIRAVSLHNGAEETFWTRGCAEFWLWLINERIMGQANRQGSL